MIIMKEYALWGTKNGVEDIIRINGVETQKSLAKTKKFKEIIERRGGFQKVRIQTIDTKNYDIKESFLKGIK